MNEQEKILELVKDESFVETLFSLESEQDVVDLFAKHGVTLTAKDVLDLKSSIEKNMNDSEELDESDLEDVSGGSLLSVVKIAVQITKLATNVDKLTRRRW